MTGLEYLVYLPQCGTLRMWELNPDLPNDQIRVEDLLARACHPDSMIHLLYHGTNIETARSILAEHTRDYKVLNTDSAPHE